MFNHQILNHKIIWLNETESTNLYASQLLKDNPADETAIVAAFQSSGKGQRQNIWQSESGKNILMSWIIYPTFLKPDELFFLNKATCRAILQFLKTHFNIEAKIKWPNDIYVGDKKIAGILIENSIMGNVIKHAIVGIGLNVNQTHWDELLKQKCTSIKLILQKESVVNEAIINLLSDLHQSYEVLMNKQFPALTDFYLKHLFRVNEEHLFRVNFETVKGVIIGVNHFGNLIVMVDGELKNFANKEIEYIIPD